ncbi:MAG TPA: hypothetical protein VF808_18110 [Ktedonobacterales bacterium]
MTTQPTNDARPDTIEVPRHLAYGLRRLYDDMKERREAVGPNPTDEDFAPLVREYMARLDEWFALVLPPALAASDEDDQAATN